MDLGRILCGLAHPPFALKFLFRALENTPDSGKSPLIYLRIVRPALHDVILYTLHTFSAFGRQEAGDYMFGFRC